MDANEFPAFEDRAAWLDDTMRFLDRVVQADLEPEIHERAAALRVRVLACAAPYDADADEEMAIHTGAIDIQDEIHRAANYRAFIRRLEEADAQNLVGCYLPERPWVQDWLRGRPGSGGGCELCPDWAATEGQTRDCEFLTTPVEAIYENAMDERWGFCRWAQRLVAGLEGFPQPPAPISDYMARVAEYSRGHGPGDNVWTYKRILNTMMEARSRAEGTQLNCRQLLRDGWQDTLARIGDDGYTAAARVRAVLTRDQAAELAEAIHYDARMYYVRSYGVAGDGRPVDAQPRRWVLDYLRTHPPAPGSRTVRWGRIPTVDRVCPLFDVDARLGVWVTFRVVEEAVVAGGGGRRPRWVSRCIGRLEDDESELFALVCFNLGDLRALHRVAEWREQVEREEDDEEEEEEVRGRDHDRGPDATTYGVGEGSPRGRGDEGGAARGEAVGEGRRGDDGVGDGNGHDERPYPGRGGWERVLPHRPGGAPGHERQRVLARR